MDSQAHPSDGGRAMRRAAGIWLLLTGVSLLLLLPTWTGWYYSDDFTLLYLLGAWQRGQLTFWQWLTWVSGHHLLTIPKLVYFVDWSICGGHTWFWRGFVVAVHGSLGWLVYRLTRQATGHPPTAFWLALVMLTAPQCAAGLAWLPGTHNLVACLLTTVAMACLLRHRPPPGWATVAGHGLASLGAPLAFGIGNLGVPMTAVCAGLRRYTLRQWLLVMGMPLLGLALSIHLLGGLLKQPYHAPELVAGITWPQRLGICLAKTGLAIGGTLLPANLALLLPVSLLLAERARHGGLKKWRCSRYDWALAGGGVIYLTGGLMTPFFWRYARLAKYDHAHYQYYPQVGLVLLAGVCLGACRIRLRRGWWIPAVLLLGWNGVSFHRQVQMEVRRQQVSRQCFRLLDAALQDYAHQQGVHQIPLPPPGTDEHTYNLVALCRTALVLTGDLTGVERHQQHFLEYLRQPRYAELNRLLADYPYFIQTAD